MTEATDTTNATDWYENRADLRPDQVFRCRDGSVVKLDRSVPGDGTKWYVADWHNGWAHYDSTIEPGDLIEELDPDYEQISKAIDEILGLKKREATS